MEVCYLINRLAPGGAPTLVLDLVRRTDDSAVEFTVCFVGGDTALVEDLRAAGAQVVGFDAAFKFDPRALWRLARFFHRESFDVVHSHLPYAQTLGRLAVVGSPGAVVGTQHNFPEQYHPVTRTLERVTRPLDDATVAVSQAVERSFTGEDAHVYPARNGRWTTIYNGVDGKEVARRTASADGQAIRERHGIGPSVPMFLSVGRYVEEKNQAAIIEAFADVRGDYPDAHLILVGWGPRHEALEDTARAYGVAEAVTVAGKTSSVESYYAAADVFVSASRTESFGIVLVEAMAAGLPVVGPDVRGAREVLARSDGVTIPPDAPDEIAAAMVDAYGSSHDHADALAAFDIGRTVDAHVELYRTLAG